MRDYFSNLWHDLWGRYALTDYFDIEAVKRRAIPVNGAFPSHRKFRWFGLYHYTSENLLVSRTRFLQIPYLTVIDLNTKRVIPKTSRRFLGAFYMFMIPLTLWLFWRFRHPENEGDYFPQPNVPEFFLEALNPSQSIPISIHLFLCFLVFFMIQWQIHDEQARATGAFRQYTTARHEPNRAWNAQKLLIVCWLGYLFYKYFGIANILNDIAVQIAKFI